MYRTLYVYVCVKQSCITYMTTMSENNPENGTVPLWPRVVIHLESNFNVQKNQRKVLLTRRFWSAGLGQSLRSQVWTSSRWCRCGLQTMLEWEQCTPITASHENPQGRLLETRAKTLTPGSHTRAHGTELSGAGLGRSLGGICKYALNTFLIETHWDLW